MIREPRSVCSPFQSSVLVLTLLCGQGCSGEPSPPETTAANSLSDDEIAELRKSTKSIGEFREQLKIKLAQRAGANITTKTVAASKKRK